jgi:hypothetical protein
MTIENLMFFNVIWHSNGQKKQEFNLPIKKLLKILQKIKLIQKEILIKRN